MKRLCSVLFIFFSFTLCYAQGELARIDSLEMQLKEIALKQPGLNKKVDISVNDVTIQEFLEALAEANKLNLTVAPDVKANLTNAFNDEKCINVLLYLCKEYNLTFDLTGTIISFKTFDKSKVKKKPRAPEWDDKISMSANQSRINLDLNKDTLFQVAKRITQLSGRNILVDPEVRNNMLFGYLQNLPLENALEKLCYSNGLDLEIDKDNTINIFKKEKDSRPDRKKETEQNNTTTKNFNTGKVNVKSNSDGLSIEAVETSKADLIKAIAQKSDINFTIYEEPKGSMTLFVEDAETEDLLDIILKDSGLASVREGDNIIIGKFESDDFKSTKIYQLQYRTGAVLIDALPEHLKSKLQIFDFQEQNSVIISGPIPLVEEVHAFFIDLDKIVPMVMIEVIMVDVNKSKIINTGLQAGIGQKVKTEGEVFPGIDVTLSSSTINDILKALGVNNIVNLGNVGPDFYASLQLLENDNYISLKSTPKLSTLNAHEASMSIGETQYYLINTRDIIGNENPQTVISQDFRETNADLNIVILPIVSGDEQVTLDITVSISNFIGVPDGISPPGTATREFKSLIRVKSDEMIVLGGLDEKEVSESGRGLPLVTRIPILKWFFSSKSKSNINNKLVVFIRPTIIY